MELNTRSCRWIGAIVYTWKTVVVISDSWKVTRVGKDWLMAVNNFFLLLAIERKCEVKARRQIHSSCWIRILKIIVLSFLFYLKWAEKWLSAFCTRVRAWVWNPSTNVNSCKGIKLILNAPGQLGKQTCELQAQRGALIQGNKEENDRIAPHVLLCLHGTENTSLTQIPASPHPGPWPKTYTSSFPSPSH